MKAMIAVEVERIGTMMPWPARSDGSDQSIALDWSTRSDDPGPARSMEGTPFTGRNPSGQAGSSAQSAVAFYDNAVYRGPTELSLTCDIL